MISLTLDDPNLAKAYDELSDPQYEHGRALIDQLEMKAGETVLDIGCGTGRLGFHVLEKIGPTGKFIGMDPLPERVAIAVAKNRHSNAEFGAGVGEDLGHIKSESVDAVYLNAVFHWIIDKGKALGEIRRVLKPGGRVGMTTGPRELMSVTTLYVVTARVIARDSYRQYADPNNFAPGRHLLTTTELIDLFLQADLVISKVHVEPTTKVYASGRDVLRFVESSTFGNYLATVPAGLRDQARRDLIAEFDRERVEGAVRLEGYGVLAVAHKKQAASSVTTRPAGAG